MTLRQVFQAIAASTGFLCFTSPVFAEKVIVDFYTHSSTDLSKGVRSKIRVIYPDASTIGFETNKDGKVTMHLDRCDPSVSIEARSYWGDYVKKRKVCSASPVEFALVPTLHHDTVETVLTRLNVQDPSQLTPQAAYHFGILKGAVEHGDAGLAAAAANDLQWQLHVSGESRAAYEYGVFAQSAGFETATSLSGLESVEILSSDFSPLEIDSSRNLVVMSNEGQSFLSEVQVELGLEANGRWDFETFNSLRSSQTHLQMRE